MISKQSESEGRGVPFPLLTLIRLQIQGMRRTCIWFLGYCIYKEDAFETSVALLGFSLAWINLLALCTSHGGFLGRHCWVLFYTREYVLTETHCICACLFGIKVHSLRSEEQKGKKSLVWVNCHLGLVTLNVMHYQSNNDNKNGMNTQEDKPTAKVYKHTLNHAKCPNASGQSTSAVRSSSDLLIRPSSCSTV